MGKHLKMEIDNCNVGAGYPCFIIAEVGQAHDGSLGIAHSYIDAVAETGADAIKFQTHIADAEGTLDEEFRIKFSREDDTRYDYWKRMEFTAEQWKGLAIHAQEKGLVFLSSAFSHEAIELLESLGMPAWKVGSGETNNLELIRKMSETSKPVLLSSGMSSWGELQNAINIVQESTCPLALFQCTSKYPSKFEEVGLNIISELRDRFNIPVGLSDHSGSIFPSMAAMAQGCDLLEVHITFHKSLFGPDTTSSLVPAEIKLLCDARDAFHTMETNPVEKDEICRDLGSMRSLFNKSVALKKSLPKGTILQRAHLTGKKPGTGIPVCSLNECVGKVLKNDVAANRLLQEVDFQ